jgi:hypothetical protein
MAVEISHAKRAIPDGRRTSRAGAFASSGPKQKSGPVLPWGRLVEQLSEAVERHA